tara:strand:- start:404 stop:1138 length:735 start_codon:yes stop_codon:yes gene_type:complete
MERLGNPYKQNTKKLTPIELLLQRMKQSKIEDDKEDVKEKVDKQYDMLVAGNRGVMLRTLHNDKTTGELSNINGKTQPREDLDNKGLMKIKTSKDFKDEAEKEYNKKLKERKDECFRGAMTACYYVEDKQKTIDSISNNLMDEHNKKAKDFNDKLKAQTKSNPLTKPTTSDYLIDPNTERIIKNPIVQKLEQQEKLKGKIEAVKSSTAYKLGQDMKERESKMMKPQKTIKLGYDVPDMPGSSTI